MKYTCLLKSRCTSCMSSEISISTVACGLVCKYRIKGEQMSTAEINNKPENNFSHTHTEQNRKKWEHRTLLTS